MTFPGGQRSYDSSLSYCGHLLLGHSIWLNLDLPAQSPAQLLAESHSQPLSRCPLCIHRINGNTALHRDIYPSVSLQIQKNFAKSKWRVSCPLQEVPGCSGPLLVLGQGMTEGLSVGFPADTGIPCNPSIRRSRHLGFKRPQGRGNA